MLVSDSHSLTYRRYFLPIRPALSLLVHHIRPFTALRKPSLLDSRYPTSQKHLEYLLDDQAFLSLSSTLLQPSRIHENGRNTAVAD